MINIVITVEIMLNLDYYVVPTHEKTCLRRFASKKGADQLAHPRRLVSAFFIHLLESFISKLASSQISIF